MLPCPTTIASRFWANSVEKVMKAVLHSIWQMCRLAILIEGQSHASWPESQPLHPCCKQLPRSAL